MGLELVYSPGHTPLEEDDKRGLRIVTISNSKELNEYEQKNIEQAVQWTIGRKIKADKLFSERFIRSLHKRMFGVVWSWAGDFRTTETTLGIESWKIPTALAQLLGDTIYWIENKTFPADEIALRFKHRLVSIHCFPNGNGRHSRLMADLIAEKIYGKEPFSWGHSESYLSKDTDIRSNYIKALKKADAGNFDDLFRFARS